MDELVNSVEGSVSEAAQSSSCSPRDARGASGPTGRTAAVTSVRDLRLRTYLDSNAKERAKRQGVVISPETVR
ncbi:MAG: hypothetical protein ACI8PT_002068 [Gammaproteobacteria bacterium]|jgi:hypothetical protein